jgi:Protein of unknown function (DUF2726)
MQFSELPDGIKLALVIVVVLIGAAVLFRNAAERFTPLPYRKKHLLSEAEKHFFRALEAATSREPVRIFTKVRLADIFAVGRTDQKRSWSSLAKISQKHVDFLLVDARSLEPLLGIELDDASHLSFKGQERDGFVNAVFRTAELPLHRIRAAGWYDAQRLREILFGGGQSAV